MQELAKKLPYKEIQTIVFDSSLFWSSYYGGGEPFVGKNVNTDLFFHLEYCFRIMAMGRCR
jgi:hypothetical protein